MHGPTFAQADFSVKVMRHNKKISAVENFERRRDRVQSTVCPDVFPFSRAGISCFGDLDFREDFGQHRGHGSARGNCELHARSLLRLKYDSVGMTPQWRGLLDRMIPDLEMSWLGWVVGLGIGGAAGTWSSTFAQGRFLSKGRSSQEKN